MTFYAHAAIAPTDLPPNLPAEQSVIALPDSAPPASDSTNYITQSSEIIGDMVLNGQSKPVRKIKISGKQLVFAKDHANRLYEGYNNAADIKQLVVYAEELVIKDRLLLPQTDVTIYARRIIFDGAIVTSSNATPIDADNNGDNTGKPGLEGYAAGNITVFAEKITGKAVLDMSGGKGGKGGEGKHGDQGKERTQVDGGPAPYGGHTTWRNDKWTSCQVIGGCSTKNAYSGGQVKPDPGKPASAPGMAGIGGKGGDIVSNLPIASFVISNQSGANGDKRPDQPGGESGGPNPIYWMVHNQAGGDSWYPVEGGEGGGPFYGQKGADAPAPEQTGKAASGNYNAAGHSFSWLRPKLLRPVVDYVKDTYLHSRNTKAAQEIITEYLTLLDTYQASADWTKMDDPFEAAELVQMASELRTLGFRIASNLDYFGNPAGWTPLLSFEATQALFEKEAAHAINVLYLDYWLREKSGGDLIKKLAVLKDLRKKAIEDIGNQRDQYQSVTTLINETLKPQASQMAHDIVAYKEELDARYQTIQQEAEYQQKEQAEKGRILGGFKAVGSILKLIPEPTCQGIGYGIDVATKVAEDYENTKDSTGALKRLPEIADAFDKGYSSDNVKQKRQVWDNAVGDIKTKAEAMDFTNLQNAEQSANGIKTSINNMGQMLKPISDLAEFSKPVTVSKEQIKATTDSLAASDPLSVTLTNKINQLIEDKQNLTHKIAEAINTTNGLQDSITQNILALDGFNHDLIDANQALDLETLQYVKEMANRAKERLLKYHYWMAKAYQYRMLETYPISLDLQRLFDKMKAIAEAGSGHQLSDTDFKSLKTLYDEQLQQVAGSILSKLDNSEKETSTVFSLSPYQLSQLNAGKAIRVNLMRPPNANEGFYPEEENIRIVDIKTDVKSSVANRFKITVEHSGISNIVKNGQTYFFEHYNKAATAAISWKSNFNGSQVAYEKPSAATESLLWSLIKTAATSDKILLFSRPGAFADFVISANVSNPALTEVKLDISYSYQDKPLNKAELYLATHDTQDSNIMPLYKVSVKDTNGRQNGLGTFLRNYDTNAVVNIEAPSKYGNWSFKNWTDESGNDLGSTPVLSKSMKNSQKLVANYTSGPDPVALKTLTVQKSGTGNGNVTSPANEISCGDVCSAGFKQNSTVTLTANPDSNSKFIGWSGACTGSTNTCTVTMDSVKTVTAQFGPISNPTNNNWERIMNWGESIFPNLFPKPGESLTIEPYKVRHYSANDTYLGYNPNDNHFYGYNPNLWGQGIIQFGTVDDYLDQAKKAGF